MSRVARTAALVVGAVALAATGIGAAASAGLIGGAVTTAAGATVAGFAGVAASTFTAVGAIAGVASAAVGALTAKKPKTSSSGAQERFTANKDQGLPVILGYTQVSGFIIHRATSGPNNLYQTFFAVLSAAGPIERLDTPTIDGATTIFVGGAAQSDYAGWMWMTTQLGQTPEPAALASPTGSVPGWDSSSKLSGYAAYCWTLKFDEKGKKYAGGVPKPAFMVAGVKVYDPRLDNTYPGGSGPCRADDEDTWIWKEEGFLHGLTWLLGRHQNGKRVIGVGAPIDGIDVPAFVEATNIAAANGWKMGGVVYSTDEKWGALKAMLQAAGGEPVRNGALISCIINAPRVSLDTIRSADLVGEASVAATQSRRERINAVVPRYRSPDHGYEMVPAKVVTVPAYVTEDGGQRTREIEYPLCQDAKIAAQLAAYDIMNAREFGPITLPLKPRWIGYKPGDCLTIDVPELNLVGQTALIIGRSLDPSTGIVTLTLKSETPAKHDFALGRAANPPPTPALQIIDPADLLRPGVTASWTEVRDDDPDNRPRPQDGADVTIENTSLNTLNVGTRTADQVVDDIATAGSNITALAGDLSDEVQRAKAKEGTLTSLVGIAQSTADGAQAAVTSESIVRADEDGALSARIDTVKATADSAAASVTSEAAARVNADGALAGRIDAVNAEVDDVFAAVTSEAVARADADGALGGRVDTVSARVDQASADVTDVREAVILPDGQGYARAVLRVSTNGYVAGTSLTNNGTTSSFDILADEFRVVNPNGGSPRQVFAVVGNTTYVLGRLQLGTAGSVGATVAFSAGQSVAGSGPPPSSQEVVLCNYVLHLDGPATIAAIYAISHAYSQPADYGATLIVGGQALGSTGGGTNGAQDSIVGVGKATLPAGNHYCELRWRASAGLTAMSANVVLTIAY